MMSSLDRTTSSTRLKDPGRMTIRSEGSCCFRGRKMGRNCYELREIFALIRGVSQDVFFWNHPILFFVRLFSFPRKIEFENSSCSVLGQLPERQLRFKEEDRGMKNLLESPIFYDWIFQVDFPRLDSKFKVLWRERCWRVVKHLD